MLSTAQLDELRDAVSSECQVIPRDADEFIVHARVFNGEIKSEAKLLVRPAFVNDVSETVKFARRHALSVSIKAGGYGIAGYAIQGDVILDLSLLDDISYEIPFPTTETNDLPYTQIRNMPEKGTKGKGKLVAGLKRRREDPIVATPTNIEKPPTVVPTPTPSFKKRREEPVPIPESSATDPFAYLDEPASTTATNSATADSQGPFSLFSQAQFQLPSNIQSLLNPSSSGSFPSSSSSGSGSLGLGHSSISTSTSRSNSDPNPQPPSEWEDADGNPLPGYLPTTYTAHSAQLPLPTASSFSFLHPPSDFDDPYSYPPFNSALIGSGAARKTRVEPVHDFVYVTFSAGAKQKDVDRYMNSERVPGRVVGERDASNDGGDIGIPYHVPFAAHPVGSSVMLLAGFGFLSRLHGLSIDALVEVEYVLASGDVITVNKFEHPDLWWAIRGCGPAFGIATRYKAMAYPVPQVFAGNLVYTFRPSTAGSLLRHIRDVVKSAPPTLYTNTLFTAGPEGASPIIAIQMCFIGSQAEGQEWLDVISSWDGERCLLNEVQEKSFVGQQGSVERMLRARFGRKWFIRSDLVKALPDDIIAQTVLHFANTPVGCSTWLFELAGGAVCSPDKEDTTCLPMEARQAGWTVAAFHQWELEEDDPRCVGSAEEWISGVFKPQSLGGPFPTFLAANETPERIRGTYGSKNWAQLVETKKKYDPEGFWKHNCFHDVLVGDAESRPVSNGNAIPTANGGAEKAVDGADECGTEDKEKENAEPVLDAASSVDGERIDSKPEYQPRTDGL
ncbi:hypothetical protein SISNIDRAFT_460776, partial [Sistotremastrum niveocremeum HHB9708]